MDNKKIVRQNATRRSIQDKLNEAMAKKPTAAFLNSRGQTPQELAGKERLIQRKVRNAKNAKRITKRPITGEPTFERLPFEPPTYKLATMPDWFFNENDVDISIIVPCFKSQEYLPEQIASWDLNSELRVEIIYVDDHCPFQSYKIVLDAWESRKQELTKPVGKIVLNSKNSGFACTCNTGAIYARGKYLIFLNADTTVTPNWLKPIYDTFQLNPNIGIIGNLILRKDGTIDSCGSEWDWKVSAFLHTGRQIYNKKRLDKPFTLTTAPAELLKPHDVEMVTGACLGIRTDLFKRIGGFDTEYRIAYWEDTELNMRVHTQGYRVHFVPDSVIYHKVGHTNSAAHAFMRDNQRLFHKRWVETKLFEGYLNGRRPDLKNIPLEKNSIVVYTAINGGYDDLKEQPETAKSENVEYVAFTDTETDSKTWQYNPICCEFRELNRNAKIHKVMPHLFFPEKEYSLWLDGSVTIEFPFSIEKLIEIYLSDCDLAVFNHPDRNCIYQEANACIARKLDDPEVIRRQIQRYTQEGYPANHGLCECSVLLRRHTPKIQQFNEMWWEEIKNGSKRDQISFNYIVEKSGIKIRHFPGDLRKTNYLFKREGHKKARR